MDYSNVIESFDRWQEYISNLRINFLQDKREAEKRVQSVRYGRGGECIHRGFYCPSIVEDIVVGNCNRGKILQRSPRRKPDYTYGFDSDGKLILVRSESENAWEFISYEKDREIGIGVTYLPKYNIEGVSSVTECRRKGNQLLSYVYCQCLCSTTIISCLVEETYQYRRDELQVDRVRLWDRKNERIQHNRYVFSVKDGFLDDYTAVELDENGAVKWQEYHLGRIYKTYIQREYPNA